MVGFDVEIFGVGELRDSLHELSQKLSDLRPLFEQYASDFYKDEKRIFELEKGPGQYEDLDPKYENQKINKWGFAYPILFASGKLARSLLNRNAVGSILIIKKDAFAIGTGIKYARYHHSREPRNVLPRRPVFFFDEKNKPLAERWNRLTRTYIEKAKEGTFS